MMVSFALRVHLQHVALGTTLPGSGPWRHGTAPRVRGKRRPCTRRRTGLLPPSGNQKRTSGKYKTTNQTIRFPQTSNTDPSSCLGKKYSKSEKKNNTNFYLPIKVKNVLLNYHHVYNTTSVCLSYLTGRSSVSRRARAHLYSRRSHASSAIGAGDQHWEWVKSTHTHTHRKNK